MFRTPLVRHGSLEVVCGPMFSGKSEELIRRVRRAAIAGLISLVATHSAIALVEYRRVMARPWPSVPPLTDDDC